MVTDPQGVPFYVMKPKPTADNPEASSHAFSYDRPRVGYCAWNELMTADPDAALHFYGQRFGWVKDGEMDMGPMGKYQFLRHGDKGMLGAVLPMIPGGALMPVWVHYFRVADIDTAAAAVTANGGHVLHGPTEVPGGDFSMNAMDPLGASFALVGKRKG
jgi:predicted enzyme related to lactoylglutathione lyase